MTARELDAEQPDANWLENETVKRREHFEQTRTQERIARLTRRESEPLHRRLAEIEHSLLVASTVAAAGQGEARGGASKSKAPPPADNLEVGGAHPEEAKRLLRIIGDATRKLEALIDESTYSGAARPEMFGHELDELLRTQYRGYSPEDVALLEPSLGSAEAIRKSRANMDPPLHRETGEPRPREKK